MNDKKIRYLRGQGLLFGVVCLFLFLETSHAGDIIPWDEAHDYYGQYVTVKGRIVSTENAESVCFLNFSLKKEDNVVVLIFRPAFDKFPRNPQDFYDGKEVLVSGKIQKYKGVTSITIPNSSRIKIVEEVEEKVE